MCAKAYRPSWGGPEEHIEHAQPLWTDLGEWIRAWRTVMRDPDKTIPDSGLGPEGQPIPAELDLHCPKCSYGLTGLTEWRCPECGESFNPRREYTRQMLRQPEYFLRYRYDPADIRRLAMSLVLIGVGVILMSIAGFIATRKTPGAGWVSVQFGFGALSAFSCLLAPILILLHFVMDLSWPSVFFRFSIPWFLVCLFLFVALLF